MHTLWQMIGLLDIQSREILTQIHIGNSLEDFHHNIIPRSWKLQATLVSNSGGVNKCTVVDVHIGSNWLEAHKITWIYLKNIVLWEGGKIDLWHKYHLCKFYIHKNSTHKTTQWFGRTQTNKIYMKASRLVI